MDSNTKGNVPVHEDLSADAELAAGRYPWLRQRATQSVSAAADIVVTLGLFPLVINALLMMLAVWLVPGFHVAGFWSAVAGSLVVSIVSFFLGSSDRRDGRMVVTRMEAISPIPRRPPPGKGPVIDV